MEEIKTGSVVTKITERREEVDVGIQGDWTGREGKREQQRNEEDRGVRLGRYGQTIRRRRRKIGAMAVGLRARQDYLPSGEHSRFLFKDEDTRAILQRK